MKRLLSVFLTILITTDAAIAASVVQRSGRTGATVMRSATKTTSPRSATRNISERSGPGDVKARAAGTQKVINTGSKVAVAAQSVVATECQSKFDGCMDSFCMIDNVPWRALYL